MWTESIRALVRTKTDIDFINQTITAHFGTVNIGVPFPVLAEFLQHVRFNLKPAVAESVVEMGLEKITLHRQNTESGADRIIYTSNDFGTRWYQECDTYPAPYADFPLGFPLEWIKVAIEVLAQKS